MKASWNTGRLYTNAGQLMEAIFDPATGRVEFKDKSRMVNGFFVISPDLIDLVETDADLQRFVMNEYDHGNYTNI